MENLEWYQSTQGPQISATIKAVVGLLIPTLKVLFPHFIVITEQIDAMIDAALILGFGGYALYGYVRAKKTLGARISNLRGQVQSLGGHVQ